jgi:hypothetical protein
MSFLRHGDKSAAYKGLIVTAILLFVMAYTIVQLTNRQFAGHAESAPAAQK